MDNRKPPADYTPDELETVRRFYTSVQNLGYWYRVKCRKIMNTVTPPFCVYQGVYQVKSNIDASLNKSCGYGLNADSNPTWSNNEKPYLIAPRRQLINQLINILPKNILPDRC